VKFLSAHNLACICQQLFFPKVPYLHIYHNQFANWGEREKKNNKETADTRTAPSQFAVTKILGSTLLILKAVGAS
jgi:hypothetical protein